MARSTFTLLYNRLHHPSPELSVFPNWSSVHVKHSLPSPSLSPWPHHPLSVCVDRALPGTSSEWGQTGSALLCLGYVTEHRVLEVHPHCSRCQGVLPFQGWVIVQCVHGPHTVCIHSSVTGRWACLHLLVSVSNAAMKVNVQISL